MKNIFIDGPITPEFIASSIAKHSVKTQIGAHQLFLGQVRADELQNGTVNAIDFTAHEEMANKQADIIKEETFSKYEITCMHIYHSLGSVNKGEACFFVFVSSPHRKSSFKALEEVVDRVKAELPIFGKEMVSDGSYEWKKNKQ